MTRIGPHMILTDRDGTLTLLDERTGTTYGPHDKVDRQVYAGGMIDCTYRTSGREWTDGEIADIEAFLQPWDGRMTDEHNVADMQV